MTAPRYPRLVRRFRAFLLDSLLAPIAALACLVAGDALGVTGGAGKLALVIVPFLILEPGLVAFTGGTIGHHLYRLRVVRVRGEGNINLLAATVRFLVKDGLGWLSLVFVLTTRKRQAAHDVLARSVVVLKNPAALPIGEALDERPPEDPAYLYPPAWRRLAVIIAYWIFFTIALAGLSQFAASDRCLTRNHCSGGEFLIILGLDLAWIFALGWATVRGWGGRLYGGRRRLRPSAMALDNIAGSP